MDVMTASPLASSATSAKLRCTSEELTVERSKAPDTRKNAPNSRIGTKPIST